MRPQALQLFSTTMKEMSFSRSQKWLTKAILQPMSGFLALRFMVRKGYNQWSVRIKNKRE